MVLTRSTPARRKAAVIHVLTNYGSTAFLIAKGLILVPLYLASFGAEGYGAWLASGNLLSLIGMLEIVLFIDRELRMELGDGDQLHRLPREPDDTGEKGA